MKSFAKYITKHLVSFVALVIVLLIINILSFGWTFRSVMTKDYGETSPQKMLPEVATASTIDGTTDEIKLLLESNNIWAMFLNQYGKSVWSVNTPDEIPTNYTIQEVAIFSKGYLKDYPVFVWDTDDGLLVLGYPKDSYTKVIGNYFSIRFIKTVPLFFIGMLLFDLLFLFLAYYTSKQKIIKSTEPIIASVEQLSEGKPVSLNIHGELAEVAVSVNKASRILSRQNEARANWISGVSHDIRTPLSMIMGYAGRIADNETASSSVKEQAKIVQRQSVKIKELIQDLNLVSQLEYEMQPLQKTPVRLSKLLRYYVADLLNTGIPESFTIDIAIAPDAEALMLDCDARLLSRAINNLVQNSINHNPKGCNISLTLSYSDATISLSVADDGVGLSPEKVKELEEKPHYMESTDDRLDLRHGLGLVLVRQIAEVHGGTLNIRNLPYRGYEANLIFTDSILCNQSDCFNS